MKKTTFFSKWKQPKQTSRSKYKPAKQHKPTDKASHQRANKLHARLKKAKMLLEPYNENKWANDFANLAKKLSAAEVSISQQELDDTLEWYCTHLRKGVPLCSSVLSFRRFFYDIYNLQVKDVGWDVTITDQAKNIAKWLDGTFYWPKGTNKQLPVCVQVSLDRYIAFNDQAQDLITKLIDKEKRLEKKKVSDEYWEAKKWGRFAQAFKREVLGLSPEKYVKCWFEEVVDVVTGWEDWSGNLFYECWSLDHRRFTQEMEDWSNVQGSHVTWSEFKEMLN